MPKCPITIEVYCPISDGASSCSTFMMITYRLGRLLAAVLSQSMPKYLMRIEVHCPISDGANHSSTFMMITAHRVLAAVLCRQSQLPQSMDHC